MMKRFLTAASALFLIAVLLGFHPVKASATDELESILQEAEELFSSGQHEAAQELLEPLADENAEAAFILGHGYFLLDDLKPAIKWLKKAVELDAAVSQYHYWLGNAYGSKAQNTSIFKAPGYAKKTKKQFELAVETDSTNLDARFALMQFHLQAPGIIGGSAKEAAHQLAEIKKIDPAWGYVAEAVTHRTNDDNDAAIEAYLAAIAAQPDSLKFQYMLTYFYQELEKPDEAYDLLESILAHHPEETDALYQIGRTGALSGQGLDKARPALQQYLLIEPNPDQPSRDWAHYRLGSVFEQESAIDSARSHYEMALKLNPDHKQAKKALKNLK